MAANINNPAKDNHWEKVLVPPSQRCRPKEASANFDYCSTFRCEQLTINRVASGRRKLECRGELGFGQIFADHMFEVEWTANSGWGQPHITPLHDLILHPACKVLHYAVECFEGMKAHRGPDGQVRLFRPELYLRRFVKSVERCALPQFDWQELLKCIVELIRVDQDWVFADPSSSLYIRPTLIATDPTLGVGAGNRCLLYVITSPTGTYMGSSSTTGISLYADPHIVRAWPGGSGFAKMGANYAPCLTYEQVAKRHKCQQILWLFGEERRLTEVGAMNIFVYWLNERGKLELVTPPNDGLILPGVTRQSILEICRDWGEFDVTERIVTMDQVVDALAANRIVEVFGSGTAAVICPVSRLVFCADGKTSVYEFPDGSLREERKISPRLRKEIQQITAGDSHKLNWTVLI